jgi:hypothetical protein
MIDLYERGKSKFDWWQDWRGECVAIVAGGPSANKVGVEKLQDRMHVVVINESYRLCPWAEILYSCDGKWWNVHQISVAKFKGLKLAWDIHPNVTHLGIKKIQIAQVKQHNELVYRYDLLLDEPGVVGSGGNSGFQVLNLVAQFGATGVALIGFDMSDAGGIHWHGKHHTELLNPDPVRFGEWIRWLDKAAPKLKRSGVDVVNCSMVSKLNCFPKVSVDKMLERWSL